MSKGFVLKIMLPDTFNLMCRNDHRLCGSIEVAIFIGAMRRNVMSHYVSSANKMSCRVNVRDRLSCKHVTCICITSD